MSSYITNRGKKLILDYGCEGTANPTNLYAALSDTNPTNGVDTNTMADITEIGAGNGYTSGGVSYTPAQMFTTLTEDDTNNLAEITIGNINYNASGGSIPASGTARYVIITTDEATVANRQVIAVLDMGTEYVASDGYTMSVRNFKLRLT